MNRVLRDLKEVMEDFAGFRRVAQEMCAIPKFGETIRFGRLRLRQLKVLTRELTKRLEDGEGTVNPPPPPPQSLLEKTDKSTMTIGLPLFSSPTPGNVKGCIEARLAVFEERILRRVEERLQVRRESGGHIGLSPPKYKGKAGEPSDVGPGSCRERAWSGESCPYSGG